MAGERVERRAAQVSSRQTTRLSDKAGGRIKRKSQILLSRIPGLADREAAGASHANRKANERGLNGAVTTGRCREPADIKRHGIRSMQR